MRFLVDMNVSVAVAEWLHSVGHDAVHAREHGLREVLDLDLFAQAAEEGRIVVTFDLDFGKIVVTSGERRVGVVLYRTRSAGKAHLIGRLREAVEAAGQALAEGAIVIVEDARIRIRRFPIGA